MSVVQTVHLRVRDPGPSQVIHAVQNDTDRQVRMVLDDLTLSSGLTGAIYFLRSDGTYYYTTATLDTTTNSFTADLDQALTCPGRTIVHLKVTDTDTVSSFQFNILVEKDTSGTISEQEGIDLISAVQRAEDAAERAEAAAAGGGSGLSDDAKEALLACFEKVAWIDEHGQDYLDALETALYPQYTVTYNLTNVNSSNQSTSAGGSYTSTLTATTGYISSVTITMGGVDITSSAFTPSS